jgi:hypothetical protein
VKCNDVESIVICANMFHGKVTCACVLMYSCTFVELKITHYAFSACRGFLLVDWMLFDSSVNFLFKSYTRVTSWEWLMHTWFWCSSHVLQSVVTFKVTSCLKHEHTYMFADVSFISWKNDSWYEVSKCFIVLSPMLLAYIIAQIWANEETFLCNMKYTCV